MSGDFILEQVGGVGAGWEGEGEPRGKGELADCANAPYGR